MQEQNANINSSVHFHGSLHPLSELVDIRVNSILMWQGASLAPAHDACQHPPAVSIHWAGQRSPAIVRACVGTAFFESSTQEILSYRPVVRARKKKKWSIGDLTCTVNKCNQREAFLKTADLSELQTSFPAKSTQASLNTGEELPFHDVCPQPVTIQRLPGLKKMKLSGRQI